MVTQLRIYTIREGHMNDWVRGWRQGVVPLRRKFGYRVEGGWTIRGESRFVWLLSHDGKESWEDLEKLYYSSPERNALTPDPAEWVEKAETWFLESA